MENGPFMDGLPIKNGGSFHSYVSLPGGTWDISWDMWLINGIFDAE